MIRGAQEIGEEEQLVLLDRPADGAAEVVVVDGGHRGLEEVAGVEIAVLHELVEGAVELVGSRLQDHVSDRAGAASQIHGVVAGGDVHRLNRFERRDQDLQQAGALVVVDAFDLVVIRHARGPVDFGLQRVRGVKELGVLLRWRRRAGHQGQQGLIIAVADQNRQLRHYHRVDIAAGVGAVRLQLRWRAGDLDGFGDVAGLKLMSTRWMEFTSSAISLRCSFLNPVSSTETE